MKFDWYYERHPEVTFENAMLEESFTDITEYKYLTCKSKINGNKVGYWRKFYKNPAIDELSQIGDEYSEDEEY